MQHVSERLKVTEMTTSKHKNTLKYSSSAYV